MPLGYQSYYYDTPDYYYRYDGYGDLPDRRRNAADHRVWSRLLTGQGYGIGQMLPASYGVYNVPLAYRATLL